MNWLDIKSNLESRRIILDNGCWILQGNDTPYPYIKIEGKKYQISRIVRKIYYNLDIINQALHKCDNSLCWNPDHIEDGTQSDNIVDSIFRGRSLPPSKKGNHFQTSCPNGHEHNEQNTYFYKRKNGKINKVCKICSKEHLIRRRRYQHCV